MNAARTVIVGGGQAAGAAVRKLRELAYQGEVVVLSDERHAPYERPPLSKEYLRGAEHEVRCIAPGCGSNERMLLEVSAEEVDPQARTVTCSDGTVWRYDALLLATGGRPRRLAPANGLAHVHYLRTAGDALALRQAISTCLASNAPLLVVGGSWIGLEVAAAARAAGVAVLLLELGDRLCARTLPPADAQWLHELHSGNGVQVRLHTSVARLDAHGNVQVAKLSDGTSVEAGAVVAGIGIEPNVKLAQQCGALVRHGVVIDAHGRTSIPGIYAAGDVAEQQCAWYGRSVRVETWDNANRQAEAAAAHIAGSAREPASRPAPWFWSDQYATNLQVVGAPLQGDTALSVQGGDSRQRLTIHLREGQVVGAVAIDRARDVRRLRKLLGESAPVTRAMLAQHGLPTLPT